MTETTVCFVSLDNIELFSVVLPTVPRKGEFIESTDIAGGIKVYQVVSVRYLVESGRPYVYMIVCVVKRRDEND